MATHAHGLGNTSVRKHSLNFYPVPRFFIAVILRPTGLVGLLVMCHYIEKIRFHSLHLRLFFHHKWPSSWFWPHMIAQHNPIVTLLPHIAFKCPGLHGFTLSCLHSFVRCFWVELQPLLWVSQGGITNKHNHCAVGFAVCRKWYFRPVAIREVGCM